MRLNNYIQNFQRYNSIIVYDFNLGDGGIGDYLKFFMIILTYCMSNNMRFYCKTNDIDIQKYIKLKHDILNITSAELSKMKNVCIRKPQYYYGNGVHYNYDIQLNEIFIFDKSIELNVKNVTSLLDSNDYISIHLRLGDKFLETDKKFVLCINDTRIYSEEKIINL